MPWATDIKAMAMGSMGLTQRLEKTMVERAIIQFTLRKCKKCNYVSDNPKAIDPKVKSISQDPKAKDPKIKSVLQDHMMLVHFLAKFGLGHKNTIFIRCSIMDILDTLYSSNTCIYRV